MVRRNKETYDFFIVVLDAADHEVHVLVQVAPTLGHDIHLKVLLLLQCRTLEVECGLTVVHNLEETPIVFATLLLLNLLVEVLSHVIGLRSELVVGPHDHHRLVSSESLLGEVTRLVVKQSVAVPRPGNTFHQDAT